MYPQGSLGFCKLTLRMTATWYPLSNRLGRVWCVYIRDIPVGGTDKITVLRLNVSVATVLDKGIYVMVLINGSYTERFMSLTWVNEKWYLIMIYVCKEI